MPVNATHVAVEEVDSDLPLVIAVGDRRYCHEKIRRHCMNLDSQGVLWLNCEGTPCCAMYQDVTGRQARVVIVPVENMQRGW